MKKKQFLYFMIILFFMVSTCAYGIEAKPQLKPEQKKPEEKVLKFNLGDFTYSATNRRDPFECFMQRFLNQKMQKRLKQ